jgi:hypothetical protein
MDEFEQILKQLGPEGLQQLIGLGTNDLQLQQAQGAIDTPQGQHSTPLGALLGGVATGAGNLAGGLRQNQLFGQRTEKLGTLASLAAGAPQDQDQPMDPKIQALIRYLQQSKAPAPQMGDFDGDEGDGTLSNLQMG